MLFFHCFCAFRNIFFLFLFHRCFSEIVFPFSMAWHGCGASMKDTLNRQEKIIWYFVNGSTDNIGYMLMMMKHYLFATFIPPALAFSSNDEHCLEHSVIIDGFFCVCNTLFFSLHQIQCIATTTNQQTTIEKETKLPAIGTEKMMKKKQAK